MRSHRYVTLALAGSLALGAAAALPAGSEVGVPPARDAEPVVLTGADLPDWSAPPADGQPAPYPSGTEAGDGVRSAHNGILVTTGQEGAPVDHVVAYRYDSASGWTEIPVQVDERFPYFLANARSDFGQYSGTDTELTYAWNPTATSVGEEAWKKVAGQCEARYPSPDELDQLVADGVITPGIGETAADYTGPMADPVPGVDADDEIVFMASDAGDLAPLDAPPPTETASSRHEVVVSDPLNPADTRAVYLFLDEQGSSFDHRTGYVQFSRSDDADVWHDRGSWQPDDPEKLGTSNTGYGPNLPGTVCDDPNDLDGNGDREVRSSEDRFPLDTTTVNTAAYEWHASGRWMIREMRVASPDQNRAAVANTQPGRVPGGARFAAREYGPDLVDRWKGRAFQQSPDSSISLVGFEDEQVNWEANAALLGWKVGPVRAIRETWGADSGTNVTKVETFYRDLVQYRYYVRVHPIPPDGLYTSWDYNRSVASTYFNALRPDGVAIDGNNDDVGQVDEVGGNPAFFDAPDPTFDLPSAMYRWEQVAGRDDAGSLVYSFDMTGATTLANPLVVPYYRDDACLDDGTGDNPVPRPWPGEESTDPRVKAGYEDYWGQPYEELECHQKQGAYGAHGLHFLVTQDSDNGFVGTAKPVNEIDGRQWQFAVPMESPTNVGEAYGNVVRAPLVTTVTPQP
ncbi:MAG: hypothetical protein R3343_05450 [Nitriliruptorales bacterium]|nr:hypothetical protein [Nitriliruptorales bacterium]